MNNEVKWYKKWRVRLIAGALAVIILVSALVYRWYTKHEVEQLMETVSRMQSVDEKAYESYAIPVEALRLPEQDALQDAVKLIEEERYEEAIPVLEQVRESDYAQDTEVYTALTMALAELCFTTEDFAKAAENGEAVLKADADPDGYYRFLSALALLQTGDYGKAVTHMETLYNNEQTEEYAYYLGVSRMANESYAEAKTAFADALERGMEDTACHYNLGLCALMDEDYDTAKTAFSAVVEANDDEELAASATELLDLIK